MTNTGIEVTPYIGISYDSWSRGAAGIISNVRTYKEIYTWYAALYGTKFEKMIMASLFLTLEGKFLFGGSMKSCNAEAGSGDYVDYTLGSRPGFLVELGLRHEINDRTFFSLVPWYETYSFGQSETKTSRTSSGGSMTTYEPSSTTKRYGVRFCVGYNF